MNGTKGMSLTSSHSCTMSCTCDLTHICLSLHTIHINGSDLILCLVDQGQDSDATMPNEADNNVLLQTTQLRYKKRKKEERKIKIKSPILLSIQQDLVHKTLLISIAFICLNFPHLEPGQVRSFENLLKQSGKNLVF